MNVASCTVGNTTYGVSNVVAWTDAHNVIRGGLSDAAEWPTCLPSVTEVKGLHFAGAWLPTGDSGGLNAVVVWVDCRGR